MYSKIKTLKKAGQGFFTFIIGYIVTILINNPEIIMQNIPDNIRNMTIGGAIVGCLVAISNWIKHWRD